MSSTTSESSGEPTRKKVLCIDDDPGILETLSLRLWEYDVDVLCGFHGMHGYWQAVTEIPDVVITDINMPQGPGDYVVECLKQNKTTQHIPVIVLTGQKDDALRRRMLQCGVSAYLTKPAAFDELREAIEQCIELRERQEVC